MIATGTSGRHTNSIAEKLVLDLKSQGVKGVELEGKDSGEWVLVDVWDVIVHVFQPETREKYALEKMWGIPAEKKEVRKKKTVK